MDFRYFAFCQPGAFYDVPDPDSGNLDYAGTKAELPSGWTRHADSEWVVFHPPVLRLPEQGWKIHVSATPENAERIIEVVRGYCLPREVSFKFIRSESVLIRRNSKYGDRGSSGKFVTVYPRDEQHLAEILDELGALLEGEQGPYILSDLRWRSGPLYVRYGGFVAHLVRSPSGEMVHCIKDADGNWVPDVRGPGFRPPAWVELPECLQEAVAARNAGTLGDFPFRPTKAMHFSNGGGVYQATDTRSGDTVLLKEARPLAGLDASGADAVERLRKEHWALEHLAGLDFSPTLLDYRKGREHWFLVREYVDGKSLLGEVYKRNPLLSHEPCDDERLGEYARWALDVLGRVERAVDAMHERGVVFGDLHPNNVLVRPDGRIALIDLEASSEVEAGAHQAMAAPGFQAPSGYGGRDVDRYALGCLRLSVFLPLTQALPWDPAKTGQFIDLVTRLFPLPDDFGDEVRRDLGPAAVAESPVVPRKLWPTDGFGTEGWPELRGRLADGILATATPGRTDRLYPGDIEQFHGEAGGANLAFGAAGVIWALARTGTDVPGGHLDWLSSAVDRMKAPSPGFYDGLAGIAYVLDDLGRRDLAGGLLDRAESLVTEDTDDTLFSGLSGLGLTLLHLADRWGESGPLERAEKLAERISGRAVRQVGPRRRPGLLHGASGSALFLLRLHERTGEAKYLDQAVHALRTDLADSGWSSAEESVREEAWRTPVLAAGAGIALVLDSVTAHVQDPELTRARSEFGERLATPFFAHAGLFTGRAGALLAVDRMRGAEDRDEVVRSHLAALGWHAVSHDEAPAFLGDQCMRLSMDLATGSAGILLAVQSVLGDGEPGLPFLAKAGTRA
ncbi:MULTISPECIES: class III lanthionine synthetase LanKC [unclassified Streptomyces]|uniref:class III lanthionine synthetase LanKC n=1 Tax=unclassified Streptomyces TaxID=2593676 RepID=UPI0016605590|nr:MULTISPECIES: class III lanthionine synthetase LanKC [unclassified Streptomyces]MBD0706874.1 hypothetical protein [Streptomyces sp. CBMA291]MBD0715010.1 hypothetical protein [Streptomyces sp. CBMA370]